MAEQVYPRESPPPSGEHSIPKSTTPTEKRTPQPGTYVIQIPKDQVYRVPPPENARRYAQLSERKSSRSTCCRCCCYFLTTILFLILAAAIAAAVIYFVFKPEAPNYSVDNVAVKEFNLTSSSPLSPEFDVTIRARNPNHKIGIYYEKDSSVSIYYEDVNLSNGVFPAFYQPTNNETLFKTALKGSDIEQTTDALRSLSTDQKKGTVPLTLKVRAPVKFEIGSIKTWKITVKVTCKITVDKLTPASKIVSNDCDYGVNLW